jgi:hypothetical protein
LERNLTGHEVAAAARITIATVSTVPADADPLTLYPALNLLSNFIDNSGNLMSRDARVLNPRPRSLLGQRVAVADAAGLDFDAHGTDAGFRGLAYDYFNGSIWFSDLRDTHL